MCECVRGMGGHRTECGQEEEGGTVCWLGQRVGCAGARKPAIFGGGLCILFIHILSMSTVPGSVPV